jgi:hypothetical protein
MKSIISDIANTFIFTDEIKKNLYTSIILYIPCLYFFKKEIIDSGLEENSLKLGIEVKTWKSFIYIIFISILFSWIISFFSAIANQYAQKKSFGYDYILAMISGGNGGAFWSVYLFIKYFILASLIVKIFEVWLKYSKYIYIKDNFSARNIFIISFNIGLIGVYIAFPLGTFGWAIQDNILFGHNVPELLRFESLALIRFLTPSALDGFYAGFFLSYISFSLNVLAKDVNITETVNGIFLFIILLLSIMFGAIQFYHSPNNNTFWMQVLSETTNVLSIWFLYYSIFFSSMLAASYLFKKSFVHLLYKTR